MAPKLYLTFLSPPCRAVLLTAEALGLKLEEKVIDFDKKEHLTPEYLKMNPEHTFPTLDDGGYIIWDSHAIITYLADKYGKDDSLYPKDLQIRGTINQRLSYDTGVLFPVVLRILRPVFSGNLIIDADVAKELLGVYELLNTLLENSEYLAGNHLTVADISIIASLSTAETFIPVDSEKFPKLAAWFAKIKELPYYSINEKGLWRVKELAANVTVASE